MIGLAFGLAGINFYTQGLFVRPLQEEFGWSRSDIGAAAFFLTLTVVIGAPVVGSMVDRFGVRRPIAFSMCALAAGFAALGAMPGGLLLYGFIQVTMAGLALGTTPITFSRAVNGHFDAARGLALGLTLCGTGIGATLAPPIISYLIETHGWRAAYYSMALSVLCVMPLVVAAIGARPHAAASGTATDHLPAETDAIPLAAMLRSPTLLRLLAIFFLLAVGISGLVMHLVPMLRDQGMEPAAAAAVQARLGIAVIAGRFVIGALVDHFFAPRITALALCITATGILSLALLGPTAAPLAAFAVGFALGAEVDMIGYLCVRYFGLGNYGRRYGILYGSFALGTGLSPLLIALLAERWANYETALLVCAGFVITSAALLVTAPAFPDNGDDASNPPSGH
jgi:MFS family permease